MNSFRNHSESKAIKHFLYWNYIINIHIIINGKRVKIVCVTMSLQIIDILKVFFFFLNSFSWTTMEHHYHRDNNDNDEDNNDGKNENFVNLSKENMQE